MAKSGVRKELMERELLDHAAQLFARNGYSGTSLREIADTAGVGRTTLYHYFSTKEDFLTALVEDVSLGATTELRAIHQRTDLTPKGKLAEAVTMLVKRVVESPMRFRVLERDEDSLPAPLAERHKTAKREALQELVAIINDGITAGEFRLVDAQVAGLTLFGMCNWPAWWFNPEGSRTVQQVTELIQSMALGALLRTDTQAPPQGPLELIEAVKNDLSVLGRMLAEQQTRAPDAG